MGKSGKVDSFLREGWTQDNHAIRGIWSKKIERLAADEREGVIQEAFQHEQNKVPEGEMAIALQKENLRNLSELMDGVYLEKKKMDQK